MKNIFKKAFLFLVCTALLTALSVGTSLTAKAEKYNSNTDWMAGKYGISMHYLHENAGGQGSTVETFSAAVAQFDVEKFAKIANEVGASWVLLTVSQSTGVTCAPNPVMEELSGLKLGTDRDLIADVYDALEPYGIRLMLYFHGGVPTGNTALAKAMGANERVGQADASIGQSTGNYVYKYSTSEHIAAMYKDFSDRYGEKISGYWIDGCYDNCGFNERIAKLYVTALKSGNPNALVALNRGTKTTDVHYEGEDYHCGERWSPAAGENMNTIYKDNITSRWTESGRQQQIWSYLGSNWGQGGTSHNTQEMIEKTYEIISAGAAVTWDICSTSIDKKGTIDAGQLEQLRALKKYIDSKPEIKVEATPTDKGEDPLTIKEEIKVENTPVSDTSVDEVKVEKVNYDLWLYVALGAEALLIAGAVVLFVLKKKA
ncbi:MAG: alpha-L-fucosidase [Clostridia bacterium]|nr:alpha-L-fucosidase [Clostridia bacterium]